MIGYKAFHKNMTCMNFQFKENEEFTHKGYFELCDSGFHFCRKLEDCFQYYPRSDCVVCRVEVPDYVSEFNESHSNKWVTNRIRILERVYDSNNKLNNVPDKLSDEEAQELLNSDDWVKRALVAENGYFLDQLYMDPDIDVRAEVAKHGVHLDVLYKDPDSWVRYWVAKQGSHLDELYMDPNMMVRLEVVRKGSHLDDLYMDPELGVRLEVAKHGVHLDELAKDPDGPVRNAVSKYKKIEPYIIK